MQRVQVSKDDPKFKSKATPGALYKQWQRKTHKSIGDYKGGAFLHRVCGRGKGAGGERWAGAWPWQVARDAKGETLKQE